jgi:hypothetical protein
MSQLRMPTSVVDNWPYYEFERYIKLLNEKNEAEKKHRDEQEHQQHQNVPNFNSISNLAKSFNPSNYKLPDFKSPF